VIENCIKTTIAALMLWEKERSAQSVNEVDEDHHPECAGIFTVNLQNAVHKKSSTWQTTCILPIAYFFYDFVSRIIHIIQVQFILIQSKPQYHSADHKEEI
jgi:hypothetical protein